MKKVGLIGCGNIAETYFRSQEYFNNIQFISCADIYEEASKKCAALNNINSQTVDELLSNKEVDVVLNLTIPQSHYEVTKKTLLANKHSYCEKPLSISFDQGKELVQIAKSRNLYLGNAPDTFLGGGGQLTRQKIDEGEIGKILTGNFIFAFPGVQTFHPNPESWFHKGGGPVIDMGPYFFTTLVNLLGPAKNVFTQSRTVYQKRVIGSGDRQGQEIEVEIPTTLVSQIEFESGALIDSFFSFDVWKHSKNHIELYGDKGSINIPDPNMFGGDILVCKTKNGDWKNIDTKNNNLGKINFKYESAGFANYRGIGVSETVDAIKNNRLNRCSGELSLHVLDILDSIIKSSKENKKIELRSSIKNLNYFSEDEISNLLK